MKTRKRNHLKNLLPDWQKPIKRMRELGVRSPMIVSFAAYCAHQGIAFTKATDAHLADYIASKVLAGAITERSAEQYRISIVASLRGLKELDPDAPATLISTDSTYALRQKQFENCPRRLRRSLSFSPSRSGVPSRKRSFAPAGICCCGTSNCSRTTASPSPRSSIWQPCQPLTS